MSCSSSLAAQRRFSGAFTAAHTMMHAMLAHQKDSRGPLVNCAQRLRREGHSVLGALCIEWDEATTALQSLAHLLAQSGSNRMREVEKIAQETLHQHTGRGAVQHRQNEAVLNFNGKVRLAALSPHGERMSKDMRSVAVAQGRLDDPCSRARQGSHQYVQRHCGQAWCLSGGGPLINVCRQGFAAHVLRRRRRRRATEGLSHLHSHDMWCNLHRRAILMCASEANEGASR